MIDINTATEEQLRELPGVGPKTAERIISNRPVKGPEELEALIPPSSWMKVKGLTEELVFSQVGEVKSNGAADGPSPAVQPVNLAEISPEELLALKRDVDKAVETRGLVASLPVQMEDVQLRRIRHGDSAHFESKFGTGTKFLCFWNMGWGPSLEAISPNDAPVQAEIHQWFEDKGVHVQFAHFGPSIRVGTRSRGFVPMVIFEIVESEEEKGGDNA